MRNRCALPAAGSLRLQAEKDDPELPDREGHHIEVLASFQGYSCRSLSERPDLCGPALNIPRQDIIFLITNST